MRGWSATTSSCSSSRTSWKASTSEDDTVFTFTLREGHQWSDGQPFTAEDFRYCWEDVILNDELTPGGGALELRADGKPPRFEVLDR